MKHVVRSRKRIPRSVSALCLVLSFLLLCSALFTACSEEAETSVSDDSGDVSAESEALVPTLGEADYSGRVLHVLAATEHLPFEEEAFGATERNSEPVNDACVDRNDLIAQSYGFKIETEFIEPFNPFLSRVRRDIMSGTATYDIAATGLQSMAILAGEGSFLDLHDLADSHLDLTAPWWDSAANADMTLMGKLFFATGDITLFDNENTRCMYYNKDIITANNLEAPTQLVLDNAWTVDKMYEMAQAAASEKDDGLMTVTGPDVWGLVGVAFDTYTLIMGCDAPQIKLNEKGLPELAMLDGKNVSAFEKIHSIMNDKSCVAWREQYYAWDAPDANNVVNNFYKGQALFLMGLVNTVNSDDLRTAEIRYGILPMPKFDVEQENYATTCDPYRFQVIGIVKSCQDTDFTTFAMETLAYLNYKMVTPEYYDRTLKYKRFLDDDDSPEMLDILFSNRLVDISVAFNWDDCIQYYNQLVYTATPQLSSFVEQHENAFNTAMNKTVEDLQALYS